MKNHSLEDCKVNHHIKSFKEQESKQFQCLCCGRLLEAVSCPLCLGVKLKDDDGMIACLDCDYHFIGRLDVVDDEEKQEESLLEKILREDDGKHEHPLGFRKGIINRDFQ